MRVEKVGNCTKNRRKSLWEKANCHAKEENLTTKLYERKKIAFEKEEKLLSQKKRSDCKNFVIYFSNLESFCSSLHTILRSSASETACNIHTHTQSVRKCGVRGVYVCARASQQVEKRHCHICVSLCVCPFVLPPHG